MRFSLLRPVVWTMLAVTLAPARAGESDSPKASFSLAVSGAVLPGREAIVRVGTENVKQLQFRLYRVSDPPALFSQLRDPSSFGRALPLNAKLTLLERFNEWRKGLRAAIRDLVRLQFGVEHRAQIRAWRLSGEQKKRAEERLRAVQASKKYTGDHYANVPLVNVQRLVRVWNYPVVGNRHDWEAEEIPVKLDEPGVYLLEATNADKRAQIILIASRLVVMSASESGRLSLRSVDAVTGAPRVGASITFYNTREQLRTTAVQTGEEGLIALTPEQVPEGYDMLLAHQGEDWAAFTVPNYNLHASGPSLTGVVYTDRPIYRPGHDVHVRAIVREKRTEGLVVPSQRQVQVSINDDDGKTILKTDAVVNAYGTLTADLKLPSNASLGVYQINVTTHEAADANEAEFGGFAHGSFQVEEYRKPEFEVRMAGQQPRVVQGARPSVTLTARYYYGEPVRTGTVEWRISRSRWFAPWYVGEEEEDGDEEDRDYRGGYGDKEVLKTKATLDAEGHATIAIPTELAPNDEIYFVDATVMDSSGRAVEGHTYLVATVASVFLQASNNTYVYHLNDTATVNVDSLDYDGGKVPDIDFIASVRHVDGIGGEKRTEREVQRLTGRTNAEGHAELRFPVTTPGSYRVYVEARINGRMIGTYQWLYVGAGRGAGRAEPAPERIRVIPDKRTYKPGDRAHIVVRTGQPDSWAWVTVESRQVVWSRYMHFNEADQTIDLDIAPEWTPDIFVAVRMIRDGRYLTARKMINIPPAHRTLNVKLTPTKREFKPGEPAVYDVEARDPQGKPARAELSLGVVDEAIYGLAQDPLPNLTKALYERVWDSIADSSSLSWFFSGQAGYKSLKLAAIRPRHSFGQLKPQPPNAPRVRKLFPDTAYWTAHLETGADGHARAEFTYPDSMTTWRATARGVTVDSLAGSAVDKVIVRKRLILAFATPRFAVDGDMVTVPVIVRSFLPNAQHVALALKATGADTLNTPTALDVAPNGEARFDWKLRAHRGAEVRLTGSATGQDESDALELSFPVEEWGLPWHGARYAALAKDRETATLDLPLPETVRGETARASVTVAPSLAASLLGSLDFLVTYPYGCTEQTLSSWLPNLAVREAMKTLGAKADDAAVERAVRAGIERLHSFRNKSGTWGFWSKDPTDRFLTAYALWALSYNASLHGATHFWDPSTQTVSANFLNRKPENEGHRPNADLLAWELNALSMTEVFAREHVDRMWDAADGLSNEGWALFGAAVVKSYPQDAARIADRLRQSVVRDMNGAHWTTTRDLFLPWVDDNNVEATAFALRFLARQDPSNPLLPDVARWLLASRDQGMAWSTTKRTAFALFGLTEYLRVSRELQPSFEVTVKIDGRTVLERSFSASDVLATPVRFDVAAGHRVEIVKRGAGVAYVSLDGTARLAGNNLEGPPGRSGFGISRELLRLVPVQRNGVYVYRLEPLKGPVRVGETILMRIATTAIADRHFLLIDAPLPAGAEAVPNDDVYTLESPPVWWRWGWAKRELRDSHALWYPDQIVGGNGIYTTLMRFTNPGTYRLGAARIEAMYQPGVFRSTDVQTVEVVAHE